MRGSEIKIGSTVKGKEVVEIDRLFGGDLFVQFDDGRTAVVGKDQEVSR